MITRKRDAKAGGRPRTGPKARARAARPFYARFRGKGVPRLSMRTVRYCLDEALSSLVRRPVMSALAIAAMTLSLVALGAVGFVGSNLDRIVSTWGEAIQLNLYLSDGIPERDLESIRSFLEAEPSVETSTYISAAEALERFGRTFADMGVLPAEEAGNPFPASFEIRMERGYRNPEAIAALASRLEGLKGVGEVDADPVWLKRLFFSVRLFRWAGGTLAGILLFASTFTIWNIIRLTVYHRQDEIEIMRLVGASEPMIRAPFVLEGVLQGLIGGVVSLALLFFFYRMLVTAFLAAGFPLEVYGGVRFLSPWLTLMVPLFGALTGLAGGALAFVGLTREGFDRHLL